MSHCASRLRDRVHIAKESCEEGATRRFHNCVYGYTDRRLRGESRIVSIRWYAVASSDEMPSLETGRLTIEVQPNQHKIVQIRGKLNRRATEEEMKVVRAWAGLHGLTIDTSWYW